MKIKAMDVKEGDVISIGGEKLNVETIEKSDIGKQGTEKCRIVALRSDGERIVLIRPANYPIEKEK